MTALKVTVDPIEVANARDAIAENLQAHETALVAKKNAMAELAARN